jgi:hypothetical protein
VVNLDEPGRGKLEIGLGWPAAGVLRLAGATGEGSALVGRLPEGASSPGGAMRAAGGVARPWYDASGS